MSEKQSWPELVGIPVDEAIARIKSHDSRLNIIKVKENSPTTRDLRPNRVRIFYDENGNVVSEPHTG
ncbi:unnamed protein product [Adineta steineri]|uniref:Uncharacterized protein n=1 Tax=Adineta steineri TaxID=433720 RepID=A0A815AAI1_9BILA|nr:unnamed protein product [Adineta steineri]CAF1540901.1 unnamed protein product [Adineta steineri]